MKEKFLNVTRIFSSSIMLSKTSKIKFSFIYCTKYKELIWDMVILLWNVFLIMYQVTLITSLEFLTFILTSSLFFGQLCIWRWRHQGRFNTKHHIKLYVKPCPDWQYQWVSLQLPSPTLVFVSRITGVMSDSFVIRVTVLVKSLQRSRTNVTYVYV